MNLPDLERPESPQPCPKCGEPMTEVAEFCGPCQDEKHKETWLGFWGQVYDDVVNR